jgi:type II secretory pathway pseudopilin PulG
LLNKRKILTELIEPVSLKTKLVRGFVPLERKLNTKNKFSFLTGFALTGMMIAVSIIALLAAIAIPRLLRMRMESNESAARATLKTISTALEAYATESKQGYPHDISVLVTLDPPYLNKNYIRDSPLQGYNYVCDSLDVSGYSCSAIPQRCGLTGSKNYIITTSGVLTETECGQ